MQYLEEKRTCHNVSESQNNYAEARQKRSAQSMIPFIEN